MRLEEYVEKTGIPVSKLASRCGLSWHQVHHILKGRQPRLSVALSISEYTKKNRYVDSMGIVEPWEMVPKSKEGEL